MKSEDLKILLALEGKWTVSLNGREFLAIRSADIFIEDSTIRFGRYSRKIVDLGPSAVELVDRTMIELSRDIPMFGAIVDGFVQGEPAALLLTEFAGDDPGAYADT